MKYAIPRFACLLLLLVCLSSCQSDSKPENTSPKGSTTVQVQAVNYPLFFFAQQITAGDPAFEIAFEAPADVDPAFWQPSDPIIANMQKADLILLNGATYAKWINQVSLPSNPQLNTSKSFSQLWIVEKGKYTHSHGNGVVHAHDGISFTTWLDFRNARNQAEAVRDGLIKLQPAKEETLRANTDKLLAEIDALDKTMLSLGSKLKDKPLLASHPVYQYLARRYQLDIRSVHWEPGTKPDEKALQELADRQNDHNATIMIWENEPITSSKQLLTDRGIDSIVFNPCANRPATGDWLTTMQANINALKSLLN